MLISQTLPSMVPGYDRQTTLDWCRTIDEGPYHSLAVGERVTWYNQEMMVLLSAAAALTERVKIFPTVVVGPLHGTGLLAKQLATLDVLSAGRVVVGLGVGGREQDFRAAEAPFARRYARLDEQAAELRRLWGGEPAFPDTDPIGPAPVQAGGPPLLAGSQGPKGLARAAKWADGVCGQKMAAPVETIGDDVALFRQAWADAGRSEAPYVSTAFWYSLDPDDPQSELHAYAHRYAEVFGPAVADWMAGAQTVAGPDAFKAAVEVCREAEVDELVLVPTTADVAELERTAALL
jgi:alkanesulfonate monooxygenase SsuD/methylene tetrahydromethanopterin reductase-like flavin-dependent oxidoreductase (luciferase family)